MFSLTFNKLEKLQYNCSLNIDTSSGLRYQGRQGCHLERNKNNCVTSVYFRGILNVWKIQPLRNMHPGIIFYLVDGPKKYDIPSTEYL